jgi:hypothetical protein
MFQDMPYGGTGWTIGYDNYNAILAGQAEVFVLCASFQANWLLPGTTSKTPPPPDLGALLAAERVKHATD